LFEEEKKLEQSKTDVQELRGVECIYLTWWSAFIVVAELITVKNK